MNHILETLNSPVLFYLFPIVLIGTFIETGTGMIHALNERIANAFTATGRTLHNWIRPVVAVILISAAILLSRWGIIDLIAVGYNFMAWVFVGVVVVPVLTIGVWKVMQGSPK